MASSHREARIDLAAALRSAARMGLHEGVCNHFSYVPPGAQDRFLINPHGWHWSEVTASSLLLVGQDGKLIEGAAPPEPTAYYIHWRLHARVPHARCVLHTHMPYATALTMLEEPELLMANQTALMFHDQIAYDRGYNGLALDESEGDRIAGAFGNRSIAFLGNHGIVVVGASVHDAYNKLYYLERACMMQVLAMSTGKKLALIPDAVVRKTAQQLADDQTQPHMHFEALKRLLDRDEPNYKD